MEMVFIIEEKKKIGWEKKVLVPTEKTIKLYKYEQGCNDYSSHEYEKIPYDQTEILTQGKTSFMITTPKNKRVFKCETKDMNNVIFTKLYMLQDQYSLNVVLSDNYKETKKTLQQLNGTNLETMAAYLMTLYPLLFREINGQLDTFKGCISNKNQSKEEYQNIYSYLRGLLYELKGISDKIYENCTVVMNDNESRKEKRRMTNFDGNFQLKTAKLFNNLHKNKDDDDDIEQDKKVKKSKIKESICDDYIDTTSSSRKLSLGLRRSNESFSKNSEFNNNNNDENDLTIDNASSILDISLKQVSPLTKHSKSLICFPDTSYYFLPRTHLDYHIKLPLDYISQSINYSHQSSSSFPITLNEPISLLQKQCEKMINCHYLSYANHSSTKQMKLCYIIAFILGELSQDLHRYMEPISPIKGETYEYCDNQRGYRFFASEISSSISAFIGESNDFTITGNTKCIVNINIPQCSIETNYATPTTIKLNSPSSCDDSYTYSRPIKVMKYKSILNTTIEYKGIIKIFEKGLMDNYAEITFEENNKINGGIYVDTVKMIELTGSLEDMVYYKDIQTGKSELLWRLNTEEKYLHNHFGKKHYYLPINTHNLNNYDEKLLERLPKTDSRYRRDIREYEVGNIKLAQESKIKPEDNDDDRIEYFVKEREGKYVYNGNYWSQWNQ